ncbi:MAG: nitrite reductase, copper-containing [Chitinophagaceae bacterium]|nr:MAG: nitrite reductase, copper-containing [Chitinophagaceae bacterium]
MDHSDKLQPVKGAMSRSRFLQSAGLLATSGVLLNWAGCKQPSEKQSNQSSTKTDTTAAAAATATMVKPVRVAADPLKVPPPVNWSSPRTHQIEMVAKEMMGEIKPGVLFHYMTFDGQVPAPMIRVRQGDTVDVTLTADKNNHNPHNVDFHSCYGTGGGAEYLTVGPGQKKRIRFKAMDPGAFIYHCAVPDLDYHIASGMFGLILVEPKGGLPKVDHEFYFGQNEMYVKAPVNEHTPVEFDYERLLAENPNYVVLNGAFNGFTDQRYGALKANKGETLRIYFVNGGPNLISSFHPIGNVWSKFWMQGSLSNNSFKKMQTVQVNPGSCAVLEMELPVPELIHLADHSITRTARKGLKADIAVAGTPSPDIFQPLTS